MSETLFTQVQYTLDGLMSQVQMGWIDLPETQRRFVRNNVKVRDLFDSMYRGYPGRILDNPHWYSRTPSAYMSAEALDSACLRR